MEAVSQKSDHGGGLLKEEIKRNIGHSSSGDDDEGCSEDIVRKSPIMPKMEISSSELQATVSSYQMNQEARLKSAKAEMGEVMEENQRLKMYLDKMMKDYRALQMQFRDTIVHQEINKPTSGTSVITTTTTHHHQQKTDQESDDQFVSLSLGRTTNSSSTDHHHHHHHVKKDDSSSKDGQLTLGLDCNNLELSSNEQHASPNPSPEASLEEVKEDTNAGDHQKGTKTMRTDDEVSQQNPAKRARVSVRVRCDTPTMNDGCQWRKYGQKIAKGNPCPRAYYRCTVAPNCPVRKQVQRCAEDMSILITTYEGTHNHPLPISATAMASTTSAAACMLLSGSSTSGSGLTHQSAATNNSISGLNFYLSDNNSINPKPFYNHLPNSSISSSSTSFPTITLDLTTNSLLSSSSASSHLTKLGNNFPPRYSTTTNLNFSSLESNSLPISWSNGVLSYGNQYHQSHNNKNQNIGSLSFGRQQPNQENLHFQSYFQKNNILNSNQLQPEALAAATKAIASDPNFQSALAAALTTIIGNSSSEKLSESFPVLSSFSTASANNSNTNKCAPNFLNYKPPSSSSTTNSQPAGSLMFTSSPSLPFSTSNSKSTSPAGDHNRDHIS